MTNSHHPAGSPPGQPPRAVSVPPPDAMPLLIGECVQAARIAANLTQVELGGTRFSKSYISAVERGKMTPSFQALYFLAERLSVSLSYLLGEAPGQAGIEELEAPTPPETLAEDAHHAAQLCEAERLLREGRYEEALALFAQAGQPERTNQAREVYAQFLADQGRYQEAYEQMRRTSQGRG